jgi:phospholipid/cholesterol/gamma-HCH transport system substrate-binding protein
MSQERKVGTVVAVALLLLLASVFLIGKVRLGVSGYEIKVQWKFLNDLKIDGPVKYAAGVVIGRVRDIYVDGEMVTAVLWIDRQYKIREDCQFWIFTTGMLGEMYVEVDASPSGTAPFITEGRVIRGIDPTSTDATLTRLGKMVDALAPIFAKEEVAASVHAIITDMRRVATRISQVVDKHTGGVDEALSALESFSKNLNKMSKDVENLMAQMKDISDPANLDGIHTTMKRLNATLNNVEDTAKSASLIARKIDGGKGSLGALVNDEKLANDIRALIRKLKDEPITVKMKLL